MPRNYNKISIAFFGALLMLTGCSLMHDDTPPCAVDPNITTVVNFVYDYNLDHIDHFDEHAGSVYLYIFDEKGVFYMRKEKHRAEMERGTDFSMTFDTTELKPGRTYQMVAVAQGNHEGYDADNFTPGFKVVNPMVIGQSTIGDYLIKLNRDDETFSDDGFGVVDYKQFYADNNRQIDTIWTTMPDTVKWADIPLLKAEFDSPVQLPDTILEITVPMMRITNRIKVSLVNEGFTRDMDPNIFDILIYFPYGNGTIDFNGTTQPAQPLYYRALRKGMEDYTNSRADAQYALSSVFGVSRLQAVDGSSLQIRDPENDFRIIAEINNFSQWLAKQFNEDYNDSQEFLDRAYDFEVDLGLDDSGKLRWADVKVDILGWCRRVYFYDL